MTKLHRSEPTRRWAVAVASALSIALLAACAGDPPRSERRNSDARGRQAQPSATPTPTPEPSDSSNGLLLASGFEQPVCGRWQRPRRGCEFGVEGEAESGPFSPRTGDGAVRLQHLVSATHVGVIADLPLPGGGAFVGVAHRVPSLNGAFSPGRGYTQLVQMSPSDGVLDGWPMEVRIYGDRTLALAMFQDGPGHDAAMAVTTWRAPVDRWFYVLVKVTNGDRAVQKMWVYDDRDALVDRVSVRADTSVAWGHQSRTAQKVGGTVPTIRPLLTFHDDFYVATEMLGPLHIGPDGTPIES